MRQDRAGAGARFVFLAAIATPIVALFCSLAALAARRAWACEIVASFRWQEAVVCAACAAVLFVLRRNTSACLTLASALHLAWPVLAVVVPSKPDGAGGAGAQLTVMSANVLFSNEECAAFRACLGASPPDVLAVQEVMPAWRRALDDLREVYPFHLAYPDRGHEPTPFGFGIAIYSRLPIVRSAVHAVADGALPLLEVELVVGGEHVRVFAMHPPAPHATGLWEVRNRFLGRAPAFLANAGPVVVLADMNTSSGSPAFADFRAATGLGDTRRGFGRLPTWRTDTGLRGLWVDLDHVLVSDSLAVVDRGVRALPGSDHLAATATLVLRR